MATRLLDIGSTFRFSATQPTAAVFMVTPREAPGITIAQAVWSTDPVLDDHVYTDVYGNTCRQLVLPAGVSTQTFSAVAEVPDAVDDSDPSAPEMSPTELPADVLLYTLPSRFCQSDVLGTQAWNLFGDLAPGYGRVAAISTWVHQHLRYTTGSTGPLNTSVDSFVSGVGVCRDFAHLMVTMCRALHIPARYAFGHLPDMDVVPNPAPMDFHAWVEVFLGGRWFTFDPRHDELRKGRVPIAFGRDAADVAMVTTYGGPWMQYMGVTAQERTA